MFGELKVRLPELSSETCVRRTRLAWFAEFANTFKVNLSLINSEEIIHDHRFLENTNSTEDVLKNSLMLRPKCH